MSHYKTKAFLRATTILFSVLLATCAGQKSGLTVGAAYVNISPENPAGLCLEGYTPRLSTGLHDSLSARCIVMDDGITRVAFITLDLLGILGSDIRNMANEIQDESGIPADNIIIHTVHTHSAPAMIGFNGSVVNNDYKEHVSDQTVACVMEAITSAKSATAWE